MEVTPSETRRCISARRCFSKLKEEFGEEEEEEEDEMAEEAREPELTETKQTNKQSIKRYK